MARLPDATALGQRRNPSASRPISGGTNAGLQSQADMQARDARGAGKGFEAFAKMAEKAGEIAGRIQTREDAVNRVQAINTYSVEAQAELERLQTETDLSDQKNLAGYQDFLKKRQDDLIQQYGGSPDSTVRLYERLESDRGQLLTRAGMLSAQIGREKVTGYLGKTINSLSARAAANPGSLVEQFRVLDREMTELSGALSPVDEQKYRDAGREAITSSAIETMIAKGEIKEARTMLEGLPGDVIGTDSILKMNNKLVIAERQQNQAQREAEQKLVAAEYLAGRKLTPGERLDLAGLTRVGNDQKDEFNRNLNRLLELEQSGAQGGTEYQLIARRLQKQTEGSDSGLAIQFNPDGSVAAIMQGQGLGSKLTAQAALTEKAQIDRLKTTTDLIDLTIKSIKEQPTRAGISGAVRSFVQKTIGIAGDAAPSAIAEMVQGTAKQFGLESYFDRDLPDTEIYENTIALELAKMRVTAGGGGIRAVESAFKAAKKDVSLRGLTSSQEVMARLETVRKEFETERNKQIQRLSGQPAFGEGATATNQQTGQKIIFRNGRWETMQ